MMHLLRCTELIGKPVITLAGESPVEIKDVVFDTRSGTLQGFTLRKHGFFGGPVDELLPYAEVHGLGPDAVIVAEVPTTTASDLSTSWDDGGNVIGDRVLTESGTDLGEVLEVVVAVDRAGEVVGFEVDPSPAVRTTNTGRAFVPLPDAAAISGENVIVPDSAADHIGDDMASFADAVVEFRSGLAHHQEA